MTEYVLSIDPGLSTGIALLSFEPDEPAQLVQGWQFPGGLVGLLNWYRNNTYEYIEGAEVLRVAGLEFGSPYYGPWTDEVTVIAEKFTARNTRGFSYTTASLEPLRGEGALIALGVMPDYDVKEKRWRDPGLQYLVGGDGKAKKKQRQHKFLKDSGFYRTGKMLDSADADDFRSAASHGLAYIARELGHKPTFNMITEWTERNPA